MDQTQHNESKPKDHLDSGKDHRETVDEVLESRHSDRQHPGPKGPAGEVTNMETHNQETVADRDETDPFR